MANITNETMRLLDQLFNLKSEDNIILKEINRNIDDTNVSIKETSEKQRDSEVQKVDCEGKLSVFENQRDAFESAFDGLDNETFAALREIDVNIEIGTMLERIKDRSPEYVESLKNRIAQIASEIEEYVQSKASLEETLANLEADRTKSEEDRDKLVSLLEQSLSSDEVERESLTTSYVKKILALFNVFSEEEIKELAKLIIFPDEGLYEYADSYEERRANGFLDVEEPIYESATVGDSAAVIPQDEVVTSDVVKDTSGIVENTRRTAEMYNEGVSTEEELGQTTFLDLNKLNMVRAELDEMGERQDDIGSDAPEEVTHLDTPENEPTSNNQSLENFLTSIGLMIENFRGTQEESTDVILSLLSSVSPKTIEDNFELLRSINADNNAIYTYKENHMYLADQDLARKITLLRAKGISEHTIKTLLDNNDSGLRENYSVFEERVQAIETTFSKINDENVSLIASDMGRYATNCTILKNNGFELEEKELRNYFAVLGSSEYVPSDINVLKNYLISIIKKNGKYELGVFWQSPQTLTIGIDDIIEAGLGDLITTHPEVLATQSDNVLRRIKFCQEKGHPVYEDGTTFCDYIPDVMKFYNKYGSDVELPELVEHSQTNHALPSIIGNEGFVDILLNPLNEYYSNGLFEDIELDGEAEEKFNELRQQVIEKLGAIPTGKHTYRIGNVCISKNKLERHLSIILNAIVNSGQSPEGVEREILLVSALYNLRQDEETLSKMVSECLGFNEGEVIGGKIK